MENLKVVQTLGAKDRGLFHIRTEYGANRGSFFVLKDEEGEYQEIKIRKFKSVGGEMRLEDLIKVVSTYFENETVSN